MQLKAIDTKTQMLFGSAGLTKINNEIRHVSPCIQSTQTKMSMAVQSNLKQNVRFQGIHTLKMSASSQSAFGGNQVKQSVFSQHETNQRQKYTGPQINMSTSKNQFTSIQVDNIRSRSQRPQMSMSVLPGIQQFNGISNLEQVNNRNRAGQVEMMNAKELQPYARELQNPEVNNQVQQDQFIEEYWDWQFEIQGKTQTISRELIEFYIQSYIQYQQGTGKQSQLNWIQFQQFAMALSEGAAPFQYIDVETEQGFKLLNQLENCYNRYEIKLEQQRLNNEMTDVEKMVRKIKNEAEPVQQIKEEAPVNAAYSKPIEVIYKTQEVASTSDQNQVEIVKMQSPDQVQNGFVDYQPLILYYLDLYQTTVLNATKKKVRSLKDLNCNQFMIYASEMSENSAPFLKYRGDSDMWTYIQSLWVYSKYGDTEIVYA